MNATVSSERLTCEQNIEGYVSMVMFVAGKIVMCVCVNVSLCRFNKENSMWKKINIEVTRGHQKSDLAKSHISSKFLWKCVIISETVLDRRPGKMCLITLGLRFRQNVIRTDLTTMV